MLVESSTGGHTEDMLSDGGKRREQMAGLRPVSMWKSSFSQLQMAVIHTASNPQRQSASKIRDL